jgi:enoyl-CoA hydratase/carnithine racemase
MELIVLGERLSGPALHQMGLVNRVVSADAVLATALQLAAEVASRSRLATSQLKKLMTTQLSSQLTGALEQERQAAMACFADSDTAQRIAEFARAKL